VQRYLAGQLSKPRGIAGRFVLGRLWNRRNAALNDMALELLDLRTEDRFLDVGFGGGYLLGRAIPRVERGLAAGIDASPAMVRNAQARWRAAIEAGRVDVREGRAEALPYLDGHFTRVSSVNSIFYWSAAEAGIAEMYRVLRPRGKVVLTFTCRQDLETRPFVQHVVTTYEGEEIGRMLAAAGFREIEAVRHRDHHREFICMTGLKYALAEDGPVSDPRSG
jgi:ubiquinone/menaquinone biosynthesis C-methylase UbiE